MKKKFITLFLAAVMVLSTATISLAADVVYNFVEGTDAVAAVDNSDVVIVDVRTPANYDKGHLKNSISIPLFDASGVTTGSDALATAFKDYVTANTATFVGKDIYIVCNSGARGAQAATALLIELGYANADIFTIKGGAKGTDTDTSVPDNFVIDYNFVSGTDAVAAIDNTGVVIVDVRSAVNYNKGHLKGAISIPLFDANNSVTNGEDALATAFTSYVTTNAATFTGKDIYIVCNSGARGAQNATKLLLNAGYALADIFTIEGGAKGTDADKSVPNALTYVSADQAISVIDNKDYVIIDVRSAANYEKGHLKGSVSVPLFDANNSVTTGSDDLAKAFTEYVNANKTALSGKTIYILCNSGARGAQNATTLLNAAGFTTNVFTIEGGAKNTSIQAKFVTDTQEEVPTPAPAAPKTGDAATSMMYVMLMVVALGAVVVASKKRFTK